MSAVSDNYMQIRGISDKYGEVMFRCGLTHLVDVGGRNLQNDELVKEAIEEIRKSTPDNSVMTADFQADIVNCAHDLAQLDIWDVLRYVKTDLPIGGWGEYEFDEEEFDEDDGYYI